ncbi:energy-coupling factor ABC transporter ATP-binding protein [Vibrio sp. SM6]|uniref:Energy-coupling factor ABC transporter ATP-binding protein n=1 Tax=Vibrio agarilyticus TaxID=2726741 RepID=A0A7X8TQ74_9VIBR|nr:energy-coupling factor ABC transporter ATP-binding protein [Vibrio agarilyticus]NLS12646.1 energy-coupling factor ABC transporter ATP-binding protein [Vibrio agarilyticus]
MTIVADGLSMRFKERVLFYIPHLTIAPTDTIYLTGDNGVGKTTLLKILAGLVKPSEGQVHSAKSKWWQKKPCNDVIYLHQSPYLFDATVYDNVIYGIKYRKQSTQSKRVAAINALRMVGLETLANEHVSVLSGGEKQRVAMARAWVLKPSILLMDEPSASLDSESIARIALMADDLLNRGASIVVTSHQTNALTELCKKQWWIKNRTLVETPRLQLIEPNNNNKNHYASTKRN